MGSVVGECLSAAGARVVWPRRAAAGPLPGAAAAAGLEDLGTPASVVQASDVILSVCPPGAATDVARLVAAARFRGLYVDANAVAPATARAVGEIVGATGADFVDGGIIGPPPRQAGTTRLYLSGPRAGEVADLFKGSALEAIVMPGDIGTASALKMAYAAWTKGSSALLLAVRALAIREGVDGRSAPSGSARSRASRPARSRPSPPTRRRPGASSARWRRSPGRSPPPGCRRASTRRALRSTSGSAGTRTRRRRRR